MVRHRISAKVTLDDDDLVIEGIRASGPGGQNVNKVSSAVSLRLDVARIEGMDAGMHERLAGLAGRRLTEDGILVIKAQRRRTQAANREDAIERVLELLRLAAIAPRMRIARVTSRGARARRLESKRRRAAVKRLRQTGPED